MANAMFRKGREARFGWIAGEAVPANIKVMVCGVSDGYTYGADHDTVADLAPNVIIEAAELQNVSYLNGILDGDDLQVIDIDITGNPTLLAAIVYFEFDGGTSLICMIDQSTDDSLPQELGSTEFIYRWNAGGICKV